MRAKWAKKSHRKMTKYIQRLNKNLYNDSLWLGRFYVTEKRILFIHLFYDHSGGEIYIEYECHDKKTGKTLTFRCDNYSYTRVIFLAVNNFIVLYIKVWEEDPRPSIYNVQDYRNV